MQQLSMLDMMIPTPPPTLYVSPPRRDFMTRAYGEPYMMQIGLDERDPIEIEVRGIPTLIRFSHGWQTYTVQPAGSAYWSETGFRSFGHYEADPDEIADMIASHIDHKNGCNGKLTKWWPDYARQWRQERRFMESTKRETVWDQWGPEKQAEHLANFDARQAAALERMKAEGIDPDEVWRTRK
jgi:hypothetical protein